MPQREVAGLRTAGEDSLAVEEDILVVAVREAAEEHIRAAEVGTPVAVAQEVAARIAVA